MNARRLAEWVLAVCIPVGVLGLWTDSARCESAEPAAAATEIAPVTPPAFNLENLFPEEPMFGPPPSGMAWSGNGNLLAYRRPPADATAPLDIWIYDAERSLARQITSATLFKPFYPEPVASGKESADAGDGNSADYPGVGGFVWAPTAGEMIVEHRGDLFRLRLCDAPSAERLTKTAANESVAEYCPDGGGYVYRLGGKWFRVRFGSSFIEELIPNIPDGLDIKNIELSPDHGWMAVTAEKPNPRENEARKIGYVSYEDRFAKMKEIRRDLAEDEWLRPSDTRVYLCPAAPGVRSGTPPAVEWFRDPELKGWLGGPVWSPSGRQAVFYTFKPETFERAYYRAETENATRAVQIHKSKDAFDYGSYPHRFDPIVSPDGKTVIAVFDDSGFIQPWKIDLETHGKTPLVTGKFRAEPIGFDESGERFFVRSNRDDTIGRALYSVRVSDGAMTLLTDRRGEYSEPVFTKDGKRFAALFTDWDNPTELLAGDTAGGSESTVYDPENPVWPSLNRIKPELFSYNNRHGQKIHGMIFLPTDWTRDQTWPLYVYTYGGPLVGPGHSYVRYGHFLEQNYRFPMYMAYKHGYVCAVIDTRGSSGYGQRFQDANYMQPGRAQTEDLADGVEFLARKYGADPKRAALGGWSFGGFQTQNTLYTEPDLFAAGIAGAGVTQWENLYIYSHYVVGPTRKGHPDLEKYSLLTLAKNLKARLLLHHGLEDTNVLFQDTVKIYQALLKAGKGPLVELVLDTAGGHGEGGGYNMGGDLTSAQRYAIYEDFLLRTLGRGK